MPDSGRLRLRAVCVALLALDLLYSAAAALAPGVPGWDMFARVERLDYVLTDASGRRVDLAPFLPRAFYPARRELLVYEASCACAKRPATAPWRLKLADEAAPRVLCGR